MDIREFARLAKIYSDLGWAVQEQFHDLVDGPTDEEGQLNANALRMIDRELLDALDRAEVEGVEEIRELIGERV